MTPPTKAERFFSPPISRSELAALYPGAALIPIQHTSRPPTEEQRAELTRLVGLVADAESFTEDEHAEALDRALADPEQALVSFRALACELGIAKPRAPDAGTVRLWLTLQDQDGAETLAALDIPNGRYDGLHILELIEKHRSDGTTKVVKIVAESYTEREPESFLTATQWLSLGEQRKTQP